MDNWNSDMSQAPKGRWILVWCDRFADVVSAICLDDGWITGGANGPWQCEPLEWQEMPKGPAHRL